MKRTMTLLALLAATLLVSAPAGAGMFKKDKRAKAPAEERVKSWRYDRLPTLSYTAGELRSEGLGQWKVGELTLQLSPKCEIFDDSGTGDLEAGREVVVTGPRVGNTIIAWRVSMQLATGSGPGTQGRDVVIQKSESDPTVGEGTAPN